VIARRHILTTVTLSNQQSILCEKWLKKSYTSYSSYPCYTQQKGISRYKNRLEPPSYSPTVATLYTQETYIFNGIVVSAQVHQPPPYRQIGVTSIFQEGEIVVRFHGRIFAVIIPRTLGQGILSEITPRLIRTWVPTTEDTQLVVAKVIHNTTLELFGWELETRLWILFTLNQYINLPHIIEPPTP
jgi:hypothetical protein